MAFIQLKSLWPASNNSLHACIRIQTLRNYESSDGVVILLHNIPHTRHEQSI